MCFLRSIWDKWVWLLSSSAWGTGRVWEVAAVAVAHAGSPCPPAGAQQSLAVLSLPEPGRSPSPHTSGTLLPSRTWLHFGAGWGAEGFQLSPESLPAVIKPTSPFQRLPALLATVSQPTALSPPLLLQLRLWGSGRRR